EIPVAMKIGSIAPAGEQPNANAGAARGECLPSLERGEDRVACVFFGPHTRKPAGVLTWRRWADGRCTADHTHPTNPRPGFLCRAGCRHMGVRATDQSVFEGVGAVFRFDLKAGLECVANVVGCECAPRVLAVPTHPELRLEVALFIRGAEAKEA